MAHSYSKCLFHCVFSTRRRQLVITPEVQPRLWAYMGGIARTNAFAAFAVGGTADHAHVLLALPATLPVAKAVQVVKAGSSKWLHDSFPPLRDFAWQEGYGAFSIGVSQLDRTVRYIEEQAAHHRRRSFEAEYVAFLKKHGLAINEQYTFD